MAWMITCEDSADGPRLRADAKLMAAHWEYELSIRAQILCAGSLRSDDGLVPQGSLLILDAATRQEALDLFAADPATRAGLRDRVTIRYWNPAILNRQPLA